MYVITGANGQLGIALRKYYPDARAVDSNQLDITDRAAVEAFDWNGVSAVINAAAYTNVDGAETNEGRIAAWRVNATGTANLVRVANHLDVPFIHVSTDYVFDGTNPEHPETEPLSPLGTYGQSKAAGDTAAELAQKHYILRTSMVIGEGKNFVGAILGLAARDISPSVVNDQTGRLTFTNELVRAIDHLIISQAPFGTYNLTNDGPIVSWSEVARRIFALAGRTDLNVTNTTVAEYFAGKNASPRPLNEALPLSKIQATGFTSKSWEDDLAEYVAALQN